jgi:hypothetical protein
MAISRECGEHEVPGACILGFHALEPGTSLVESIAPGARLRDDAGHERIGGMKSVRDDLGKADLGRWESSPGGSE